MLDPVRIPALTNILQDDDKERVLCPVRALSTYLNKSKPMRKGSVQLFIPIRRTVSNQVSGPTISRWIVSSIRMVYEDLKENHEGAFAIPIKAHELRGVSASLARMVDSSNNFSTKQIVDSVGWKSQNSFLSFYFKDLTPSL